MIYFKKVILLLAIFLPMVMFQALHSGPTVIQDDRVTNLTTTPVLGRGYSISTNTFQSSCLQNIVMTEPSYDFSYLFQEMDEYVEESSRETDTLTKLAPKSFKEFVDKKNYQYHSQWGNQGRYDVNVDDTTTTTETETQKKSGLEEVDKTTKTKTKMIIGKIDLHSYYASVDESASKISDSASKLLTGNDIPAFFSSCGSYYIRSITRKAQFISVFEFESVSEEEDRTFVYNLETELKSFRKRVVDVDWQYKSGYSNYASAGNYSYEQNQTLRDETQLVGEGLKDTFSKDATSRSLTITATAFGLGKNKKASLISYDIETFKAAIKDAFLSMQNPRTGKVDSIEVIPWVENTEFQSLVKLEEAVDPAEIKKSFPAASLITSLVEEDSSSTSTDEEKPKMLLLYEKKMILNINAEFLAELNRTDRAMLNLYYKAKLCRKNIDSRWVKRGNKGEAPEVSPRYTERYLMNNRYPDTGVRLVDFNNYLTQARVDGLLAEHRKYVYGGGDWGKGARSCMNNLMQPKAIFTINYRDFKDCQTLEENLGQIEESIVENHCMPRLFDKWNDPKEVDSLTDEAQIQEQTPEG